MKRVLFKVAQALKEAGYPQDYGEGTLYFAEDAKQYLYDSELYPFYGEVFCVCPTYLEAWLWLWREKKIKVSLELSCRTLTSINADYWIGDIDNIPKDPEEAIIAAIDYLCDNDLIK